MRLLMAAWDELAADGGVGVPLVIAGTGPLEPEVTAWAAGRDDVRYVGLYDTAECRKAVARSVAVVAPSTWLEAFGLVVVEAMAAGVPVVAAGHGAFVELVEDGVTGLLHRPGEPASLASCLRRITAGAGPQPGDGPGGPAPLRAGLQPGRRAGAPGGGVPHRDRGSVRRRGQPAAGRGQKHWLAAGAPARAGWGQSDDTMPTLRLGGAGERRRSGGDPAVRELSRRGATGPAGAGVPAAPAGLHRLLARADPAADHAGGDVHASTPTSPPSRPPGWSTRARSSHDAVRAAGSGRRRLRGRGREQRRLPAAARGGPGDPLPRHRALGERRRRRRGTRACPRSRRSWTRTPAPTSAPSTARRTWSWPTTCTRTSPTWSGSPGGCAPWSPTTAGSPSRCSTC